MPARGHFWDGPGVRRRARRGQHLCTDPEPGLRRRLFRWCHQHCVYECLRLHGHWRHGCSAPRRHDLSKRRLRQREPLKHAIRRERRHDLLRGSCKLYVHVQRVWRAAPRVPGDSDLDQSGVGRRQLFAGIAGDGAARGRRLRWLHAYAKYTDLAARWHRGVSRGDTSLRGRVLWHGLHLLLGDTSEPVQYSLPANVLGVGCRADVPAAGAADGSDVSYACVSQHWRSLCAEHCNLDRVCTPADCVVVRPRRRQRGLGCRVH